MHIQSDSLPIRHFEYHELLGSTSDRIKELLKQPEPPELPCLVIAKTQTTGRGRENKKWWSGEGALLMSLGFEIQALKLRRDELPLLSLATAWSVLEVLREELRETLPPQEMAIHLPNDVYVGGKKISGILLESPSPKHVVLGIGINVNNRIAGLPAEHREHFALEQYPITSVIDIRGEETEHSELVQNLLRRLQANIEKWSANRDAFRREIDPFILARYTSQRH